MKKRKFKSLVTLYYNYEDGSVTDENPRNQEPYAEFNFARKGTIFTLETDDDEETKYPFQLGCNKVCVWFKSEDDMKKTGWFEEYFAVGDRVKTNSQIQDVLTGVLVEKVNDTFVLREDSGRKTLWHKSFFTKEVQS